MYAAQENVSVAGDSASAGQPGPRQLPGTASQGGESLYQWLQ